MSGVNPHRGEIQVILGGEPYRLCLTLGGLAELEHHFGAGDLMALSERLGSGTLTARDCVAIIGAGLRGGGAQLSNDDVAVLSHCEGAAGYVAIVADLLNATFGGAPDMTEEGAPADP